MTDLHTLLASFDQQPALLRALIAKGTENE